MINARLSELLCGLFAGASAAMAFACGSETALLWLLGAFAVAYAYSRLPVERHARLWLTLQTVIFLVFGLAGRVLPGWEFPALGGAAASLPHQFYFGKRSFYRGLGVFAGVLAGVLFPHRQFELLLVYLLILWMWNTPRAWYAKAVLPVLCTVILLAADFFTPPHVPEIIKVRPGIAVMDLFNRSGQDRKVLLVSELEPNGYGHWVLPGARLLWNRTPWRTAAEQLYESDKFPVTVAAARPYPLLETGAYSVIMPPDGVLIAHRSALPVLPERFKYYAPVPLIWDYYAFSAHPDLATDSESLEKVWQSRPEQELLPDGVIAALYADNHRDFSVRERKVLPYVSECWLWAAVFFAVYALLRLTASVKLCDRAWLEAEIGAAAGLLIQLVWYDLRYVLLFPVLWAAGKYLLRFEMKLHHQLKLAPLAGLGVVMLLDQLRHWYWPETVYPASWALAVLIALGVLIGFIYLPLTRKQQIKD